MSYQIEYLPDQALVLITIPAVIDPAGAQSATREVIRLVTEHQTKRILCDATRIQLAMTVPDLYRIVDLYHAEGMPYGARIAIAAPPHREDMEKLEIFGIAALNRGYTVRVFRDLAEARQWLLHEPNVPKVGAK